MRRCIILALFLFVPAVFGARVLGVPETDFTRNTIIGAWVHKGFYYVFQDSVMTAVKTEGEPKGYKSFKYTIDRMDGYNFVRYGSDLSDSSGNNLLLVEDVSDSTAVLAFPTTFVRADSGAGLLGMWKHVVDLTAVEIVFQPGTLLYRQYTFDRTAGADSTIESKTGRIRAGIGKYFGRFYITFDDGTKTTILPVIFGDLMYLYDLSPRKSLFIRTEHAPSFREYQQAAKGKKKR
ncbi:MAG: hypothetical protein J7M24_00980 [Candidatus Latescibacteria bacterium]|nr:hypothetical protein [Candidatus Latescibacterota bacterium]